VWSRMLCLFWYEAWFQEVVEELTAALAGRALPPSPIAAVAVAEAMTRSALFMCIYPLQKSPASPS
jgi:hypothetical protein